MLGFAKFAKRTRSPGTTFVRYLAQAAIKVCGRVDSNDAGSIGKGYENTNTNTNDKNKESRWHRQLLEARELVKRSSEQHLHFMVDTARVRELYNGWQAKLPNVGVYYAVKCNPDPRILRTIAELGGGFDCASENEIVEAMHAISATSIMPTLAPGRIMLAHPCKRQRDLACAAAHGVQLTVADNDAEMRKIAASSFKGDVLLRLRCDDASARICLGTKYGVTPGELPALLRTARREGLHVRGLCFHVGSAARDPVAFSRGLDLCVSLVRGHRESFSSVHDRPGAPADAIVDIGGGFSADTFEQVARAIGQSSKQNSRGLRIVAEPGRYFAETACTLVAMVQGVRHRSRDPAAPDAAGARDRVSDYYISDGLYGSLNCVLYDNQRPAFSILRSPHLPAMAEADASPTSTATVWGPTCDSADKVLDGLQLPELRIGDFLVFHDAGAYTLAGACEFNGIQSNRPFLHYYDSS